MLNAALNRDALDARLDAFAGALGQALADKAALLAADLAAYVRDAKLSGQVLQARTGALRDAIVSDVSVDGGVVSGSVGVAGDIKYAAIQEYGGKTAAHEILPVKAMALAFASGAGTIFARRVEHPGLVIPERSYLRSSLDDKSAAIIAAFARTPDEIWRGG